MPLVRPRLALTLTVLSSTLALPRDTHAASVVQQAEAKGGRRFLYLSGGNSYQTPGATVERGAFL